MVFLDANVLIYYLDETAEKNVDTVTRLQRLVDEEEQLVTSHHVVEEVLFALSKIEPNADLVKAVNRIGKIPGLILAEPSPHLSFAKRYAALRAQLQMGVNDVLLLQLMLDAGITHLFSYDMQFVNKARSIKVKSII